MSEIRTIAITPVGGFDEIATGDSIGDLLADVVAREGVDLQSGDVVVVTSKVISKAEGRVVADREREILIAEETARVVAERGLLKIVRTRQGLVMAAAGVDASNTEPGTFVLLPEDPDASARQLRTTLRDRLSVLVGVLITDTAGRAWRNGQTDIAIGAAGIRPMIELAGTEDTYGNILSVTAPAVADEIAGAADLVMGKTSQCPVAIIRGLDHLLTEGEGSGARALIRAPEDDLFGLGTFDVLRSRRTVRRFTGEAVPVEVVMDAIADALTAPAPHHGTP